MTMVAMQVLAVGGKAKVEGGSEQKWKEDRGRKSRMLGGGRG